MNGDLSAQDIDTVLTANTFGHLGCSIDNKPCVFPMAYAYHDNVIYGQTTVGKKVEIIRNNPTVCFQVEEVDDNGWRSVLCWGEFQELDFAALSGKQAVHLVKLLTNKLGSIQQHYGIAIRFSLEGQPVPVKVNGKETTLFRIVVTEKAGRWQRKAPAAKVVRPEQTLALNKNPN